MQIKNFYFENDYNFNINDSISISKSITNFNSLSPSNSIPKYMEYTERFLYSFSDNESEPNNQNQFNMELNNNIFIPVPFENIKDSNLALKNNNLPDEAIKEQILIPHRVRIRSSSGGRPRREFHDNIRRKIKTKFFNKYIVSKINKELKISGSIKYFEKYPYKFVADISRQRNKIFLEMTLMQIMKNKEIYGKKEEAKYYHNLRVLESLNLEENSGLKKILNAKYIDLYDEFINSNKFIEDLEEIKNENDVFKDRYIYLSKTWNKYFSEYN